MIILGSICWGIASTMIQWLLDHDHASVEWLIPLRLIPAGLVILITLLACKKNIWIIWTEKSAYLQIALYGIVGILGLQYSFMNTIANGNAVSATLFQFLGPVLIAAYITLRVQRLPASIEWISMFAAFLGIFLVVTGGSFHITSLSIEGILWGLLTSLTFAFYTVYPINLLQKWGPALTSGWGMLIGGIFFGLFGNSLNDNVSTLDGLDPFSLLLIGFIILFGTGLAFFLYVSSLRYLKPVETSILTSVEPLTTILLSFLWLAQPFVLFQSVGGLLIVGSAVLLTMGPRTKWARSSE
ncbi:DMT family transporter [Paenibacillus sp. GYB003]|uniref:DMT family transporter n=1 Tax=Paenibacillus sp. GYB003 TaxID=2994392 RepID=UPI002F968296